jgi:lipoate-protein ligase A
MQENFPNRWRLINTGFNSGIFNMALDTAIAFEVGNGSSPPTIRFFGWKPYAISLGYNQNFDDINLEKCKTEGIDIVKRPTGGRAILHSEEVTYSVIMPKIDASITEIYNVVSFALLNGIRRLGVHAEFEKSQIDFKSFYKTDVSVVCFSASAKSEIKVKGKKLVGSAQRRFDNYILQHGSILLGGYHEKLYEFLNVENRQHLKNEIELKTTNLKRELKRDVLFEEVCKELEKGFLEEWRINLEYSDLTDNELELCSKFEAEGLLLRN